MIGKGGLMGRLERAMKLARDLGVRVIASDATDETNAALYADQGIMNLRLAHNSHEEVISVLDHSRFGRVLLVTSPDHLPRLVREAMAQGASHAFFAASYVSYTHAGPGSVDVTEPARKKH